MISKINRIKLVSVFLKYLGFFQTVPCWSTLRKSFTARKINKVQNTLYLLFSALVNISEKQRENRIKT